MKAQNVYQIYTFQTHFKFMHKATYGDNIQVFIHQFCEVDHQYPVRFSKNSFSDKKSSCKIISFAITLCGPTTSNNFLRQHEKSVSFSQNN